MFYAAPIGTLWAIATDGKGKVPKTLKNSRWTSKIEAEQALYQYEKLRDRLRREYHINRLSYYLKTGKRWQDNKIS